MSITIASRPSATSVRPTIADIFITLKARAQNSNPPYRLAYYQ